MDNVILIALVFALMQALSIGCIFYGLFMVCASVYRETKTRHYTDEGFPQILGCLIMLCGVTMWFCINPPVSFVG